MPSGAKKRKALKKKKEQEAIGDSPSNKSFNCHGYDEHGSQDEGESDGNMSSPGSQGNGEFWRRDPSPSPLSGLGKNTIKEKTEDADVPQGQEPDGEDFIALGRGTGHEKNGVDTPPNFFSENVTHKTRKAASKEAGGTLEIAPAADSIKPVDHEENGVDAVSQEAGETSILETAPAADSIKPVDHEENGVDAVSQEAGETSILETAPAVDFVKPVITEKMEQFERSTDSVSIQQKTDENEEERKIEEAKEGNIPGSAAETSKEMKSVKESQVPDCSEEKSLLPSGPPVVRTSWLSCCGLFDVMAGSER